MVLPKFLDSGEVAATAKGGNGPWAGIVLHKIPADTPFSQAQAETPAMSPLGTRCESTPAAASTGETPESHPRKVLRLKETFGKRDDLSEKLISETPLLPWVSTELGTGQFKAQVDAVMAKRLEEWQGGIQAKVLQALDIAEQSNKACTKMAQQLEELVAAPFATVPQIEESIRETVAEMKMKTRREEAEHSDEVKGTVAAVFDDLHGCLEPWVCAIESRIYNIEQVVWSAVSLEGAAKTSSGNTASSSTPVPPCEAMEGEIELLFPVVHCLRLAVRQLEGDIDIIRKSFNEQSFVFRHMESSFRSELDVVQLSIKELGNQRHSCIAGRSAKLFSGDCAGDATENTDSGCQADAKESTVQECTQRLCHVELDMMRLKDEIKAQAVALDVIQHDYQVQQTLLKVNASHGKHHAEKLKASSVEIEARHQDRPLHHKTSAVSCLPFLSHVTQFSRV
jgi:hypothetical protein